VAFARLCDGGDEELGKGFLVKVKAEVDRIMFFGLGLKVDALSNIRRSMGRVLSRLGLKPKLLFGLKWRGRRKTSGLSMRPRSLMPPGLNQTQMLLGM
jgi:hypothetical protein